VIFDPASQELITAVGEWLASDIDLPAGAFSRRVAGNALDIVAREQRSGAAAEREAAARLSALLAEAGDYATLNARLADALRTGAITPGYPGLLDHLKATALAMLAIDQPRYAHELQPRG